MITKTGRIEKNFSELSFNSRLLFKELAQRKILLRRLRKTHIVIAKLNKHKEVFYDIYSNNVSYTKGLMIDDKYYAKEFLSSHQFPVNAGKVFQKKDLKQAISFAEKVGFPVVIKPAMSSHGDNVIMNIKSGKELKTVVNKFAKTYIGDVYFLIEKQFDGEEYRIFITKNNFFAAVHRVPANITGDGRRSIKQLINRENHRRMNPRNTCLCIIPIDSEVIKFLKRNNQTVDYVPKKGEKVQLRQNSNVSTGGNCYDVTDIAHPSYIKFARKLLETLDVPFVGIDLMCKDISKISKDFVVCELNSAPGLSLHMMPEIGTSRDVASAIADLIFPETK